MFNRIIYVFLKLIFVLNFRAALDQHKEAEAKLAAEEEMRKKLAAQKIAAVKILFLNKKSNFIFFFLKLKTLI